MGLTYIRLCYYGWQKEGSGVCGAASLHRSRWREKSSRFGQRAKCALHPARARARPGNQAHDSRRRKTRADGRGHRRAGYVRIGVPPLRQARRRGERDGAERNGMKERYAGCQCWRTRLRGGRQDARTRLSRLWERPGEGPAAVQRGKVLRARQTTSCPGPRIAIRGRLSLAGGRGREARPMPETATAYVPCACRS